MKGRDFSVLVSLISLGLITALLLASCAAPAPAPASPATAKPTTTPVPVAKPWPKLMTIAGGEEGTSGYALAAGLSKQIEEKLKIPVTVTTATSAERIRLVVKGEAEIGNPSDLNTYQAMRGIGGFEKEGKQPLRILSFTYPLVNLILTRGGIKSFPELRGKRLMFDNPAYPQQFLMLEPLLKFHKMTRNDIVLIKFARAEEISDGLIAGTIDSGMRSTPPGGMAAMTDLVTKANLTLLSLSDDELAFVLKESGVFGKHVLPAGVYKGQDKPVQTTFHGNAIIVRPDFPEDLAYAVLKILMDSVGKDTPGEFTKFHKVLNWTLQDQVNLVNQKLGPFHPGAIKYFKERGIWTAEMDKIQAEMEALVK